MIYAKLTDGTLKDIMDLSLFEKCSVCGTEIPFNLDNLTAAEPLDDETFETIFYGATLCASCTEKYYQLKKERHLNMATYLRLHQSNEEKE